MELYVGANLRWVCTGRTGVVLSIAFSPLFIVISLRQTSQKKLFVGANQGLHRVDQEVSSILVVSSIPCSSPKSYDGFVPVVRGLTEYTQELNYEGLF
jgi:hypothetical protein